MRQLIIFLILVGGLGNAFCESVQDAAWITGQEFLYDFQSQTLTGMPDVNDTQKAGFHMSSQVRIQTHENSTLMIKFDQIEVKTFNIGGIRLDKNGWIPIDVRQRLAKTNISSHVENYLKSPFSVRIKKGIVQKFSVEKTEPNFVTNLKRAFLSQIQIDLQNVEKFSHFHVFESREKIISGDCKPTYLVKPIGELDMADKDDTNWKNRNTNSLNPNVTRLQLMCQGKSQLKIEKIVTPNDCHRRPIFRQWLGIEARSQHDEELSQESQSTSYWICRAGSNFLIKKAEAKSNKRSGQNSDSRIESNSLVRIELLEMKSLIDKLVLPNHPIEKSSLIFEYDNQDNLKVTPTLVEASKKDIMVQTEKLFREVSQGNPISPVVINELSLLSKCLRTLSKEELHGLKNKVLSISSSISEDHFLEVKELFYDLIATVGTNPSTTFLLEELGNGTFSDISASGIIMEMFRSIRTPTEVILKQLVEATKSLKTFKFDSRASELYHSALNHMSNLLYRACINPARSRLEFPIKVFGKFCSKDSNIITDDWIPYLNSELSQALRDRDEEIKILSYINSLGKLGHPEVIKYIITEVLSSKNKKISSMVQSFAVSSFKRVAMLNSHLVRPLLKAIIENTDRPTVVRLAAISLLPWTKPSSTDLLKLSTNTWYEPSDEVNCFLHTAFKSLAQTTDPELRQIGQRSAATIHLMKPCDKNKLQNLEEVLQDNILSDDFDLVYNLHSKFAEGHLSFSKFTKKSFFKAEFLSIEVFSQQLGRFFKHFETGFDRNISVSETVKKALNKIDHELKLKTFLPIPSEVLVEMKSFEYEKLFILNKNSLFNLFKPTTYQPVESINRDLLSHFGHLLQVETFAPTITGFMLYEERSIPFHFSCGGSIGTRPKEDHVKAYTASVKAGFQGSHVYKFGVLSPLSQEFLGTGTETRIQVTLPEIGAKLEMKSFDEFSLKFKLLDSGRQDFELFYFSTKSYTVKSNLKLIGPIETSQFFSPLTSGRPSKKEEVNLGQEIGIDLRFSIDSDAQETNNNNIRSLLKETESKELKLVYIPGESRLDEIQFAFDTYNVDPLFQGLASELIQNVCKENYPRSVLEYDHCLHFLSHLEEISQKARTECHKKSFPNEKARVRCHRTADICKKALEFCTTPHGPRTRRCHQITRVCKSRFYDEVQMLESEGLQSETTQFKLTKSIFSAVLKSITQEKMLQFVLTSKSKVDNINGLDFEDMCLDVVKIEDNSEAKLFTLKMDTQVPKTENIQEKDSWIRIKGLDINDNAFLNAGLKNFVQLSGNMSVPESIRELAAYQKLISYVKFCMLENFEMFGSRSTNDSEVRFEARFDSDPSVTLQLDSKDIRLQKIKFNLPKIVKEITPGNLESVLRVKDDNSKVPSEFPDQCYIDTRTYQTFSGNNVTSEMSDCLHLLFKDCSGNLPFAILAKAAENETIAVQVYSGRIVVSLEPYWSNLEQKMRITLNVENEVKEFVLSPDVAFRGQSHSENDQNTGDKIMKIFSRDDIVFNLWFYREDIQITSDGRSVYIYLPTSISKNSCGLCGNDFQSLNDSLNFERNAQNLISSIDSGSSPFVLRERSIERDELCSKASNRIKSDPSRSNASSMVKIAPIPVPKVQNLKQNFCSSRNLIEDSEDKICFSKEAVSNCSESKIIRPIQVDFTCLQKSSVRASELQNIAETGGDLKSELSDLKIDFTKTVYSDSDPCECDCLLTGSGKPENCHPLEPNCCCCGLPNCGNCGPWCFVKFSIFLNSVSTGPCSDYLITNSTNGQGKSKVNVLPNCGKMNNSFYTWKLTYYKGLFTINEIGNNNGTMYVDAASGNVFTSTTIPNLQASQWNITDQNNDQYSIVNNLTNGYLYLDSNNEVKVTPNSRKPDNGSWTLKKIQESQL